MVEISIQDGDVVFEVQGWSRLWALKRRIKVPLAGIRGVHRADPAVTRNWCKGLRLPGTYIPGVIIAGTYYQGGKWRFWDVRNARRAIVVDLEGTRYTQLIVEVRDPERAIDSLRKAIDRVTR